MRKSYTIHFREELSELDWEEKSLKGWYDGVKVEIDNQIYPLTFYDSTRIKQDADSEIEAGYVCLFEPNIIIISEVTLGKIQEAIEYLMEGDYFRKKLKSE